MNMNRWMLALAVLGTASVASAVEVSGTVLWSQRVELGTPVSGVVARVNVAPGARVDKGTVLVALDDRRFKAELARARAEAERLEQVHAEAQRENERAQELYDRTLLSDHELEVTKIALATAAADYQAARSAVTQAELDLEYSAVRAPFKARVLDVHAGVGQAVAAELTTVPLVTVAEAGRRIVRAIVDQERLASLSEGQTLSVRVGGKAYQGTIRRVGLEPAANAPNLSYPVDILIDVPEDAGLRAGQPAFVQLP
jgi:multidrug efflux system membrane fusion protein